MPTRMMTAFAVALLSALLVANAAQAKKGGGGKPPTDPTATPAPTEEPLVLDGGTIYYNETPNLRSIAPDGTGEALVAGIAAGARPSERLHSGKRWFLAIRESSEDFAPGTFPGGYASGRAFELDATYEGATTPVALTDNAGSCIQMYGSGGVRFDWAPDNSGTLDGAVSFIGTRWADDDGSGTCDRPVDGGIFRGAISIDGAGDVSFIQPTSPEIVVPLIAEGTSAEEFDWAPDGLQVAYSRSEPGMWVATAAGTEQIYDESVLDLAWSPDLDLDTAGLQTLIAFHGWRFPQCGQASLTYVMETDGSGLTLVAGCESGRKSSTGHIAVDWSPTGTHLMETTTDDPWSIQIMAAGGSGQVTLVSGSRGTWVGNASAAP